LRLFETHGVHRNQIPRFFGHGLKLKHIQAESVLIEQLDEPVLSAASPHRSPARLIDGAIGPPRMA
jgi:hypothetical protein